MADEQELPVRVWLAERAKVPGPDGLAKLDMQSFKKKLLETFVPVTYQAMRPFGLTAYIPTLWPYPTATDAPLDLPEESALVFYKSDTDYKKTKASPLGRLYGEAHNLLFEPGGKNRGGYPQRYVDGSKWSAPYFGGEGKEVSWASGQVWAMAWAYAKPFASDVPCDWVKDEVLPRVHLFKGVQQWVTWSSPAWTVLWVHTGSSEDNAAASTIAGLSSANGTGRLLFLHPVRDEGVNGDPFGAFTSVNLDFDQSIRVGPVALP